VRLDDRDVVRKEYADETRLVQRRLDYWGIFEGSDPQEVELVLLAAHSPQRALDAGCGTGEFAERVSRKLTIDVVGVDQSEKLVELARARGLDARVGDLLDLDFDDGEFDAVIANWVLYHLPDLAAGLRELARVLRSGGRLFAITNSERHLEEIWDTGSKSVFNSENGSALLGEAFVRVERHDVVGSVLFAGQDAFESYLEAFSELGTPTVRQRLTFPLRATCRNSIFVAEKA
jgi:SAM-dependent methyltransferase